MKNWENRLFYYVDKLISKIIDNEFKQEITPDELELLNIIYDLLASKYVNRDEFELLTILKRLVQVRLPHPAVMICFPGFKEKIQFVISNYKYSKISTNHSEKKYKTEAKIQEQTIPRLESVIKALYPNAIIERNVNINKIIVKYLLRLEKLAFIDNDIINNSCIIAKLKYYQNSLDLNFIVIPTIENITHLELRREIIYQKSIYIS